MRFLFLTALAVLALHASQHAIAQTVTAVGKGNDTTSAKLNSHVSAHFKCNRKGLWADLDKLRVVSTDQYTITIPGSKKKFAMYDVEVTAPCVTTYQKLPTPSN